MDRRAFLQLLSAGAASAAFPASIARALEIPANHATGTIADVEHIVFLMQENRSFDHYFGTLRGVRGFGDPRAVRLPSGDPVWQQPDEKNADGYVLPFHPPAPKSSDAGLGLTFLEDLAHDWTSTHAAWNRGRYDQWVPSKGPVTMAHLTRSDIPFHYALADAFTVCDAYHCSLLGPTDPNRYHMWTGWVGNDGKAGGPAVGNEESGYGWTTYPERLQKAGVSWKVYQDAGLGLDAAGKWGQAEDPYIGNYGDNALLYFHQYENAGKHSPLAKRAKTGTHIAKGGTQIARADALFEIFAADVKRNRLPQVSWVVAPEAYSEHPNWPANYGAWYVSQILDALTANPKVWSSTVFILMFDENDGFFDHMVPPMPPAARAQGLSTVATTNEIFPGNKEYPSGPYGLGVRVPMIVISPWSKGGWVNSEVFDHTSLIRFVEQRFGVQEPNITPWRRAVAGDLTSVFDFKTPHATVTPLPSTVAYRPPDREKHPDYKPAPPVEQRMPVQEAGTRPARALPYELHAQARVDRARRAVELHFRNTGKAAAVFHVRTGDGKRGAWSYTVGTAGELSDSFPVIAAGEVDYSFSVYGPNGFFRAFSGDITGNAAQVEVDAIYTVTRSGDGVAGPGIILQLRNADAGPREITIHDGYAQKTEALTVAAGATEKKAYPLDASSGWYDLLVAVDGDAHFQRHIAGHVETGSDSVTDPAIGKA
ncbi:MAG: phospholipase C, phosphocholine-specific [Acidobacteriaceae bacterium]